MRLGPPAGRRGGRHVAPVADRFRIQVAGSADYGDAIWQLDVDRVYSHAAELRLGQPYWVPPTTDPWLGFVVWEDPGVSRQAGLLTSDAPAARPRSHDHWHLRKLTCRLHADQRGAPSPVTGGCASALLSTHSHPPVAR